MKILLVEDDDTTVESIKLGLEVFKPGSIVVSVDRGSKAIAKLKEDRFDVVFLDLGLPDIDGIEVLKQIRGFTGIHIIVISASTNSQTVRNARELGANDFILKPFSYHGLLDSLAGVTAAQS
jgi:two-component system, OmpR family, KDP operon response regulator KdpE